MPMTGPLDPQCRSFQAAIDVLGRPWTALILALLQKGPLRFGELGERTQGITDKVLAKRLRDLETRGIVARDVDGGPPVRVAYALTTRGEAFEKVAQAIERWGRELAPVDEGPRPSPRRGAGRNRR
jgi:DNA-binding HxlR family transcriptional regulator